MNKKDFSYGLRESKYPSHYDEPLALKKHRFTVVAKPTLLQKLVSLWLSARPRIMGARRPRY